LLRSTEEAVAIGKPADGPKAEVTQDQSRNVLLIDDEALVRAVGEGMLKHHGYTVTCATNGQEGMDYLKTHADEIDPVITDLTMPVMSGKEVLREVRKRYPQIPVIVSSGYSIDPETFSAESGSHLVAVVSKPFSMEEMLPAWLPNESAYLFANAGSIPISLSRSVRPSISSSTHSA
jgi:CheY-like chemotaxis protein